MVRPLMTDVVFLAQKALPADAGDLSVADDLKESDFYALDPARVSVNGTLALTRLLDGTIWTANSPLKIAG